MPILNKTCYLEGIVPQKMLVSFKMGTLNELKLKECFGGEEKKVFLASDKIRLITPPQFA